MNNTYDDYTKILHDIKKTGKLTDYKTAGNKDKFIVLRHDVEFSMEKAYQMALIENQNDIKSTYFIQIGSEAYNAFSEKNIKYIKEMKKMGHCIGLHYRQSETSAEDDIKTQLLVMSKMYGFTIDVYSTHRPKKDTNYDKYRVDGAINAYGEKYFTRTDDYNKVKIKYISDSKYQWNYGFPCYKELEASDKVQLLIHPFQWDKKPIKMEDCFEEMLQQVNSIMSETYINEFTKLKEAKYGREKLDI